MVHHWPEVRVRRQPLLMIQQLLVGDVAFEHAEHDARPHVDSVGGGHVGKVSEAGHVLLGGEGFA